MRSAWKHRATPADAVMSSGVSEICVNAALLERCSNAKETPGSEVRVGIPTRSGTRATTLGRSMVGCCSPSLSDRDGALYDPVRRDSATSSWGRIDEEPEFSGGGLHCDLGHFLRLSDLSRPPDGQPARRYSPPERRREIGGIAVSSPPLGGHPKSQSQSNAMCIPWGRVSFSLGSTLVSPG